MIRAVQKQEHSEPEPQQGSQESVRHEQECGLEFLYMCHDPLLAGAATAHLSSARYLSPVNFIAQVQCTGRSIPCRYGIHTMNSPRTANLHDLLIESAVSSPSLSYPKFSYSKRSLGKLLWTGSRADLGQRCALGTLHVCSLLHCKYQIAMRVAGSSLAEQRCTCAPCIC